MAMTINSSPVLTGESAKAFFLKKLNATANSLLPVFPRRERSN